MYLFFLPYVLLGFSVVLEIKNLNLIFSLALGIQLFGLYRYIKVGNNVLYEEYIKNFKLAENSLFIELFFILLFYLTIVFLYYNNFIFTLILTIILLTISLYLYKKEVKLKFENMELPMTIKIIFIIVFPYIVFNKFFSLLAISIVFLFLSGGYLFFRKRI